MSEPQQQWFALTEDQVSVIKTALALHTEALVDAVENVPERADYADEQRAQLEGAYLAVSASVAAPIQRLPSPGDRWRSLSSPELSDVCAALTFFDAEVNRHKRGAPPDRVRLHRLTVDANDELRRRDGASYHYRQNAGES